MQKARSIALGTSLLALLAVGGFYLTSADTVAYAPPQPDLMALLNEYASDLHTQAASGARDQDLHAFYNTWLDRFDAVTSNLQPQQVPDSVRYAMLALAKGADDYAFAEAIAADGARYGARAADRLSFLEQRVAIRAAIASQSGAADDIASVKQTADDALAAVRDMAMTPDFTGDPGRVLDTVSIFRTAVEASATVGDENHASELCAEAAQLTAPVAPSAWDDIGWGWAPEEWYSRAADYALQVGDTRAALAYVDAISTLPAIRKSASFHACVLMGDAARTENFHPNFGRAWLAAAPTSWTPDDLRLAYALGFWLCSCSPDQTDKAEGTSLLESVLAAPPAMLQLADADASAEIQNSVAGPLRHWQTEPVRSGALTTLALTYDQMRLDAEASQLAQQIVVEYPEHPSISTVRALLK